MELSLIKLQKKNELTLQIMFVFLKSLIPYLPEEETKYEAPEGVCALCWGFQEYDGKIRQLFKDKQIDVRFKPCPSNVSKTI